MAKNFDYILLLAKEVPGFKRLYEYCDMAETLQATYPEASANSSRKALEWLVKNMLKMKNVQIDERKPSTICFISQKLMPLSIMMSIWMTTSVWFIRSATLPVKMSQGRVNDTIPKRYS